MSLTLIGPGLEELWKTILEPWTPGFPKLCSLFFLSSPPPGFLFLLPPSPPLCPSFSLRKHAPSCSWDGACDERWRGREDTAPRGTDGVGGCQVSWVLEQKRELPGGLLCPSIALLHPNVLFCAPRQPQDCQKKGRARQPVVKLEGTLPMVISGPYLLGKKWPSKVKLF